MKKTLFALIALAALAPLVHAQCFERSSLGQIMAGPCVQHQANRAYARVGPLINAVTGPGGYGGYSTYSTTVGSIGRRERTIETTAACAAIGAAAGGFKGLLIGSGICLAGNATYDIVSGRRIRKLREHESRAFQAQAEQEEQTRERESQNRATEARTEQVRAETEAERIRNGRWVFNRTGQFVRLFDNGRFHCDPSSRSCTMRPGENWQVSSPQGGFWTATIEMTRGNGLVQMPAQVRSVGGRHWEIVGDPNALDALGGGR